MGKGRRSRSLAAFLLLAIAAIILAFYLAVRRAENRLADEARRAYLGGEADMTDEERRQAIDYLTKEIESAR